VLLTIRTREGESIDLALPSARLDAALRERLTDLTENYGLHRTRLGA